MDAGVSLMDSIVETQQIRKITFEPKFPFSGCSTIKEKQNVIENVLQRKTLWLKGKACAFEEWKLRFVFFWALDRISSFCFVFNVNMLKPVYERDETRDHGYSSFEGWLLIQLGLRWNWMTHLWNLENICVLSFCCEDTRGTNSAYLHTGQWHDGPFFLSKGP